MKNLKKYFFHSGGLIKIDFMFVFIQYTKIEATVFLIQFIIMVYKERRKIKYNTNAHPIKLTL